MNESAFYKSLKQKTLDTLHLQRVETKQADGLPDIIYINKVTQFQGLIELKALEVFPKTIKSIELRPEQVVFAHNWSNLGGTSYVLCNVSSTEEVLLWQGKDVLPATKDNVLGCPEIIPFGKLNQLFKKLR